jgi:peptidoglycan-associated lipoprotein
MIPASRTLFRACFSLALLATVFTMGCKHPPKAEPPAPAPAAPAPSRPTVSIQASPTSINKGDSSTLTWTSTDATSVTIAPEVGTVTAQGSTKVSPSDSTTYTITATGPGGSADSSARVTVNVPVVRVEQPKEDPNALFLKEVHDAYFDLDKADIRADAREILAHDADFLRNYPQIKVSIEGHCDERGSTEYNLALGDRRAAAVKNYLVSLGISADRMSTVSYGKEKPVCAESNEGCWQQNRRGHFVKAN